MRVNGEDYLYRKNLQGDITGIYNPIGNLAVEYTYDAWGKLIDTTGFLSGTVGEYNSLRYRGYYYDSDTGLYYLNSRYYDPETCRFVNSDGEVSGASGEIRGYNLYSYCFYNPIMMTDESGSWPNWGKWLGGLGLAVIGVAAVVTTVATCGAAAPVWATAASLIGGAAGTACIGFGASEMAEASTGYNVIRDGAMRGDHNTYRQTRARLSTTANVGSAVGGIGAVGSKALKLSGKSRMKVKTSKLINNPVDEYVTISPKQGLVTEKIKEIQKLGTYGDIYATPLPNGYFQITNGHHTVEALRCLGKETINIYLTK